MNKQKHKLQQARPPLSDNETSLAMARANAIASTIKTLGRQSCIIGCSYFAYKGIAALAGRTTLASIGLQVAASLHLKDKVELTIAAGSVIWALAERRLRRRKLQQDAPYIRKLEEQHDPERSSSRLTTRGTTPPEEE